MKALFSTLFHCATAAAVWHGGAMALSMLTASLVLASLVGFCAGEDCDTEPNE